MTTYDFAQQIKASGLDNVSILRAANFLDNWASSAHNARDKGVLVSMFLPLGKKFPMVSSVDIGQTVAQLLMQGLNAPSLSELKGPEECSAQDVAIVLSSLLNQIIPAVEVPTEQIAPFMASKGMPSVSSNAFQEIMQGFNSGHIVFTGEAKSIIGTIGIEQAIKQLLQNTSAHF